MSEEILKALMLLFAILTKQAGGVEEDEKMYVRNFLIQQLGDNNPDEYYRLFNETSSPERKKETEEGKKQPYKLTSVLDSVRILGICKKINKTLNQSQKVVVLVRLFELISVSKKHSTQRIAIINTVSDVFRIPKDEHNSIETFVLSDNAGEINNDQILIATGKHRSVKTRQIQTGKIDREIIFLRVPSVNLYFLKYPGDEDLFLNGLVIRKNRIYHFARGSTVKLPKGKPVYYSDVVANFLTELTGNSISFIVKDLHYQFKDDVIGLQNISFSAQHGNLFGILGASGAGKTTLLNVLSGIIKPSSGNVRINGLNLFEAEEELQGVIGYVPQDDLLIEELTVFENLFYNARLCFGKLKDEDISEKVNHILFSLGLNSL